MKKLISLLILIVMIMGVATVANATTSAELPEKIYELAAPYGMTNSDKLRIERYLKDNPVSDEDADQILAKVREVLQIFKDAGITSYVQLTEEQANQIKSIANETADILGLTIKFKPGQAYIYKNGKLIEVVTLRDGKLAYTGNNANMILVVSSVVVIALATGFIARKKFANA